MGHLSVPELAEWELTKRALGVRLQFFRKENTGLRKCKPALLSCACTASQGEPLLFVWNGP